MNGNSRIKSMQFSKKHDVSQTSNSVACSNTSTSNLSGMEYPIDIWFLISEYIQPEDIGRFSGICKATHSITCTESFWNNIYKHYCKDDSKLPISLRPNSLKRRFGLRVSVIRALFYTHHPLMMRVYSPSTLQQHPNVLIGMKCIAFWSERVLNWKYYFHMKSFHQLDGNKKTSSMNDVTANCDENCQVLLIHSKESVSFPPVLGMTLTAASIKLSAGFISNKLELWFHSGIKLSEKSMYGHDAICVTLDNLQRTYILNWWHPLYRNIQTNTNVLETNNDQFW